MRSQEIKNSHCPQNPLGNQTSPKMLFIFNQECRKTLQSPSVFCPKTPPNTNRVAQPNLKGHLSSGMYAMYVSV